MPPFDQQLASAATPPCQKNPAKTRCRIRPSWRLRAKYALAHVNRVHTGRFPRAYRCAPARCQVGAGIRGGRELRVEELSGEFRA